MSEAYAELVPIGGGDAIPLVRHTMTLGRRRTCDICLDFPNISGQHCEFSYKGGVWHVRDLGSQNGVKVNGEKVSSRVLKPGDQVGIASNKFTIQYQMSAESQALMVEQPEEAGDFSKSLMEKAGLAKKKPDKK